MRTMWIAMLSLLLIGGSVLADEQTASMTLPKVYILKGMNAEHLAGAEKLKLKFERELFDGLMDKITTTLRQNDYDPHSVVFRTISFTVMQYDGDKEPWIEGEVSFVSGSTPGGSPSGVFKIAYRADGELTRFKLDASPNRPAERGSQRDHEQTYPYIAYVDCLVGGQSTYWAPCFNNARVTVDGRTKAFNVASMASSTYANQSRNDLQFELSPEFQFMVQGNGDQYMTIRVIIRDRSGNVVFEDQKNGYGVIKVAN